MRFQGKEFVLKRVREIMIDAGKYRGETIQEMVWVHAKKPWVRGHLAVLISPLRNGLKTYLDIPVIEGGGRVWYLPSVKWWVAHARSSHPPGGQGCDAEVHTAFLTQFGESAEFMYASLLPGRTIRIMGKLDFAAECRWWRK